MILKDSITHFNTSQIPLGQSFIVLCFSPYCPYCRAEIDDIIKNINKFKSTKVYLITSFPISDMILFYEDYHLSKYKNILIAQDYKNAFLQYYNIKGIPYTAVYNEQKKLKSALLGKSDATEIKEIIQ